MICEIPICGPLYHSANAKGSTILTSHGEKEARESGVFSNLRMDDEIFFILSYILNLWVTAAARFVFAFSIQAKNGTGVRISCAVSTRAANLSRDNRNVDVFVKYCSEF